MTYTSASEILPSTVLFSESPGLVLLILNLAAFGCKWCCFRVFISFTFYFIILLPFLQCSACQSLSYFGLCPVSACDIRNTFLKCFLAITKSNLARHNNALLLIVWKYRVYFCIGLAVFIASRKTLRCFMDLEGWYYSKDARDFLRHTGRHLWNRSFSLCITRNVFEFVATTCPIIPPCSTGDNRRWYFSFGGGSSGEWLHQCDIFAIFFRTITIGEPWASAK